METHIDTWQNLCGFDSDFLRIICFTGDIEKCRTLGYIGKKEKNNVNYFVTGSMQVQLKEFVERDGMWRAIQDYANQRPAQHTTIFRHCRYRI